jgi:hypothetical protein
MASKTRSDGTPRLSADNPGSAGGVKDGYAVRRADGWESPPSLGWLKSKPADPQGDSQYTKIGPRTALWENRNAAKTLGQAQRRKPPR